MGIFDDWRLLVFWMVLFFGISLICRTKFMKGVSKNYLYWSIRINLALLGVVSGFMFFLHVIFAACDVGQILWRDRFSHDPQMMMYEPFYIALIIGIFLSWGIIGLKRMIQKNLDK